MSNIIPIQETLSQESTDSNGLTMPSVDKSIIIFLVDDDKLYLMAMENQFSGNPHLVIKTFSTGEACLENLYLKPDVIVLDYFLNTDNKDAMDGLKTLLLIKDVVPRTQVIISSSNDSVETAVNCVKLGAFDYIVKNENTFLKLKKSIKKILSLSSKEKEIIVWDW